MQERLAVAIEVLQPLHDAEDGSNAAVGYFDEYQVWEGTAYRLLWHELLEGGAWVRTAQGLASQSGAAPSPAQGLGFQSMGAPITGLRVSELGQTHVSNTHIGSIDSDVEGAYIERAGPAHSQIRRIVKRWSYVADPCSRPINAECPRESVVVVRFQGMGHSAIRL